MLGDLMARGRARPRFDPTMVAALRDELERALGPILETTGAERIVVTKRALSQVHACEAHYQSERQTPFEWNLRNAVGTVVHRAVELSVTAAVRRPPLELVGQAMESLTLEDPRNTMRRYLQTAPEPVLSELRASANEAVAKFCECWPPLKAAWIPRAEMRIRTELCGDRVELNGRVDLALGRPEGDVARELFVDLKTGRGHAGHLDDLRFYALIQCLRTGIPPFRVASYYFDTATFHHEDVTAETLEIAVRRTIDGVRKISELAAGRRAPALTPGPSCSYCRLNATCDGAREWAEERPGR